MLASAAQCGCDRGMSEPLVITSRPGVTRVRINRPEQGNALDIPTATALVAAIHAAEQNPTTAVLTLTGTGRLFCGGGDVEAMAAHSSADRPAFLTELADAAHSVMRALAGSRLVILAAVNGAAAGAGLGLVLNSDLVVATDQAKFLAAYASIGLTPDSGATRMLPHILGHQRAMEMLVGGKALTAAEAKEWGLINEVSPADRFEAAVTQWESRLLRVPAQVLATTKGLARQAMEPALGYSEHLDREATLIAQSCSTPESQLLIERFASQGKTA